MQQPHLSWPLSGLVARIAAYFARRGPALARPACPQCRGALRRVQRRPIDHLLSYWVPVRRYRCRAMACDWAGTLRNARFGTRERLLDVRARFPDRLHLACDALVTGIQFDRRILRRRDRSFAFRETVGFNLAQCRAKLLIKRFAHSGPMKN